MPADNVGLITLKRKLLLARGLTHQNGQPLYLYRLSEAEFLELENAIRDAAGASPNHPAVANPASIPGFPSVFVLYTAEWWRRRYAGSTWSWEPILSDLHLTPDWLQSHRSECVRRGLQDWGLSISDTGGLRYLGSVAIQGGLPVRLLEAPDARGGMARLLGDVLWRSRNTAATPNELRAWVESHQDELPKTYRQAVVFALLASVVATVLALKREGGLVSSKDAVERLNNAVPGWRDRFPLPIEDGSAQRLIEKLIRDVADMRTERLPVILLVERRLTFDGHAWTLTSSITLGDLLPEQAVARLFNVNPEVLPAVMSELAVRAGDTERHSPLRRLGGQSPGYRPYNQAMSWSGEPAALEHRVLLGAADGRGWVAAAPSGAPLDHEMPWIFNDDGTRFSFVKQGAGKVAPENVLAALPIGWRAAVEGEGGAEPSGDLVQMGRAVWRCRGSVRLIDPDGGAQRLITGQPGAYANEYVLSGSRYWLDFIRPSAAYLGLPSLYLSGSDRQLLPAPAKPQWRYDNGTDSGLATVLCQSAGEVLFRSRVLILPPNASHRLSPWSASRGEIRLVNWGVTSARLLSEGVTMEAWQEINDLVLSMSVESVQSTPETVLVELHWPKSTAPVQVRMPFPAQGVRMFAADGREVRSHARLSAQRLAGYRLAAVMTPECHQVHLHLNASDDRHSRHLVLQPMPDATTLTLRLNDYATDISHLLSIDDRTDAAVRFRIKVGDSDPFTLIIPRYEATLIRGDDVVGPGAGAPPDMLNDTVMALRLQDPGSEPEILARLTDAAGWQFNTVTREPGSWLIYPASSSLIAFRPLLWTVQGEVQTESPLALAVGIANETKRAAALDAVIAGMAADFSEPCWGELERLATQVGHLPLPNLDLWRRFARSPSGMAALAMRYDTVPEELRSRFDQELPFAWVTIPTSTWCEAMVALRHQCDTLFPPEAAGVVFAHHLSARIRERCAHDGALAYQLGIASADLLPGLGAEFKMLSAFGHVADSLLYKGEQSPLMHFRQRHVEDVWPSTHGIEWPEGLVSCLQGGMPGYMEGIINLPRLLAAQTRTGSVNAWFEDPHTIHVLRTCRAFDPSWFDDCYNHSLAHFLVIPPPFGT